MRLGVAFMVFDGEELLPFAVEAIRPAVDHLSVTYQTTSYFGNPCTPDLVPLVEDLVRRGLVDEPVRYENDLALHHKENELRLRNLGREASARAGCTHHISLDVDEFIHAEELGRAKEIMSGGDWDYSVAPYEYYYKHPTYLVTPSQGLVVTLIHPVDNAYAMDRTFPHKIEMTRRLARHERCRTFGPDEITIHHMSYVRRDLRRKYANNDNKNYIPLKKLFTHHDTYKVGERVCLLPDWINRRTREVPNAFGIEI